MHPKNRVPRGLLGGLLLLGLMFSLGEGGVRSAVAQPEKQPGEFQPAGVVVPLNGMVRVNMSKRKVGDKEEYPAVKSAKSERNSVAVPQINPDDPRFVILRGVGVGNTKLLLSADGDKQPEVIEVTVRQTGEEQVVGRLVVSVKGTLEHQMAKRRVGGKELAPQINKAETKQSDLVEVKVIRPNTVELIGKATGITKLSMVAEGETEPEVYEVVVVEGVEFLRYLLQESVPTANVTPIRGAGNTIILTGWVAHSEDIDTIMRISRSFTAGGAGGADIVNAIKVAGVMQVQLDVVVARVSRGEVRRMAFDLFNTGGNHQFTNATGGSIINPSTTLPDSAGSLSGVLIGTPNGGPVNSFLAIFSPGAGGQNFFLLLQALRDNSLAKLLTQPRLVTLSGHAASINDGGSQPVPQVAGLGGAQGVNFVPFGTSVNFLPVVLGNGKIYLEVDSTVEGLNNALAFTPTGGTPVAGRSRQYIRTAAELQPGQTLVIGGLIQNEVQATTSKMPILGDLPFIGVAFSRKNFEERESELVIMVTPYLVDPLDCYQLPKLLPGQETRSPDDFELFLEGILEAPRGQRQVCPDRRYVPAYKNSPTTSKFPCGDCVSNGASGTTAQGCLGGKIGGRKCGSQGCALPQTTTPGETFVEAGALPSALLPVAHEVVPATMDGRFTQEVIVPVSATGQEAMPAAPAALPATVPTVPVMRQ